jgi:hypothetical protein
MTMAYLPGFGEGGKGLACLLLRGGWRVIGPGARKTAHGLNPDLTFCCDFPQQPE